MAAHTTTKSERLPLTGAPIRQRPRQTSSSARWTQKLALVACGLTAAVLVSIHFPQSTWTAIEDHPTDSAMTLHATTAFCDTTAQSSGYIQLPKKKDGHLFYWFFESRGNPATDPLVLWLQGGPGASSMMALLTENGPCMIAADGVSTVPNPTSWTRHANVIWLDQPVGTGFSYGAKHDLDHTSVDAGANVVDFLQGWLKKHPKFAQHPFFVTGESFGGHYVPAVATALLLEPKHGDVKINLQGIAIGNGFTNPLTQMRYQPDLLQDNAYGKVIFNDADLAAYKQNVSLILGLTEQCYANDTLACTQATAMWTTGILAPLVTIGKVNQYDLRKAATPPTLLSLAAMRRHTSGTEPPLPQAAMQNIENDVTRAFLNNPSIQSRLHIVHNKHTRPWTDLSQDVFGAFMGDMFRNYEGYVRELLERGVRVLIYAGDADLVCNWKGNQAWTNELSWSGQTAFQAALQTNFTVEGVTKGVLQAAKNLAFLRLFDAGHMVPEDQPEAALAMINRFLTNSPL
ncbi:Aste57867_11525 [Aphanomyces stellatus]|uniref:Aste57867_11525 protein n=1 Tax=Aphanomyces stellatus TaxID=120398 RepID=A0A485KT86_9STRA|nr:hypothetical protein As57867_011482 [Aphanomyces stellatus]VFT88386.1 Aste57867_11525 [Aphanomyces stellatus]